MRRGVFGIAAIGAVAIAAGMPLAAKKIGSGPWANVHVNVIEAAYVRFSSQDGRVEFTQDDVRWINCRGCDRTWFIPGSLVHARNTGSRPVCFAMTFQLAEKSYPTHDHWGSGTVYYLKGKGSLRNIAGMMSSQDRKGDVNLNYTAQVTTWDPIAKNKCGANPAS